MTPEAPKVPVSVLNTESTLVEIKLKINSTPNSGGQVLGILKPIWQKTQESEMRLNFLESMLERDIVLRDMLKFGQIIGEKLRAESSREEELGRKSMIELMRIKLTDEKRYYRESKKIRETVRDYVRRRLGRRQYDSIMEKIKISEERRRGGEENWRTNTITN